LGLPQFYQQGFDNPFTTASRRLLPPTGRTPGQFRPNFTLNYGLRYELDVQYGNLNTDKDNFAPRRFVCLGSVQRPQTVVRAGYGIFYSPVYAQIRTLVQTLGIVNGFRQIAQVFVPLPELRELSLTSATIFRTLFAQGKVQCTTPAPGSAACITRLI